MKSLKDMENHSISTPFLMLLYSMLIEKAKE